MVWKSGFFFGVGKNIYGEIVMFKREMDIEIY